MGSNISFDKHIHISNVSKTDGVLKRIGFADINNQIVNTLVENNKLKYIQISEYLPKEAYQKIDFLLSIRPDISFRLFYFLDFETIDISFLLDMPHVNRLTIDCIDFKSNPARINFDVLSKLKLKSFRIECFDLRNYEFIQNLSNDLEELSIMADTMGPGISFDCTWLLKYRKLHTLWLGKKAKKNLESIGQIATLKSLSLRGIKINDFSFLHQMNLEKLALLWNSNCNLHDLSALKSLKEIELWRINKLTDISFISELTNLEVIKLDDLKHVVSLPDLSKLTRLQNIFLIDTGIDLKSLPDYLQSRVYNWDNR